MPSLVPRIHFDKMFGVDVEVLMSSKVTSMVRGSLNGFRVYLHIATDGAVVQKKAGVGICAVQLGCSSLERVPDCIFIFEAEVMVMVSTLRNVPEKRDDVVIIFNSRSV